MLEFIIDGGVWSTCDIQVVGNKPVLQSKDLRKAGSEVQAYGRHTTYKSIFFGTTELAENNGEQVVIKKGFFVVARRGQERFLARVEGRRQDTISLQEFGLWTQMQPNGKRHVETDSIGNFTI